MADTSEEAYSIGNAVRDLTKAPTHCLEKCRARPIVTKLAKHYYNAGLKGHLTINECGIERPMTFDEFEEGVRVLEACKVLSEETE